MSQATLANDGLVIFVLALTLLLIVFLYGVFRLPPEVSDARESTAAGSRTPPSAAPRRLPVRQPPVPAPFPAGGYGQPPGIYGPAGQSANGGYGPPAVAYGLAAQSANGGYGPPAVAYGSAGQSGNGGYGPPAGAYQAAGQPVNGGYGPPPAAYGPAGQAANGGYVARHSNGAEPSHPPPQQQRSSGPPWGPAPKPPGID
jgi:hypothetical protein